MKKHKSKSLALLVVIGLIIPALLGIAAAIEHFTIDAPEETTQEYIEKANDRYLQVVNSKYQNYLEANQKAADAAYMANTNTFEDTQIADILGIDPAAMQKENGYLIITLSTGEKMSVSPKSICINGKYYMEFSTNGNGGLKGTWEGYNSANVTPVVIAGKARTLEECATIAMVADSVEENGGDYRNVNVRGDRYDVLGAIFFFYIGIEIALIFVVFLVFFLIPVLIG